MKTCFKCGELKPLDMYYVHKMMADGHLNKCKECTKKDTGEREKRKFQDPEWREKELDRHREKAKRYREECKPSKEENKVTSKKWQQNHPTKRKAHNLASSAIKCGRLIKRPCEICGNLKVEAHHDDYEKPLSVRWLCKTHHAEHHVQMRRLERFTKDQVHKDTNNLP